MYQQPQLARFPHTEAAYRAERSHRSTCVRAVCALQQPHDLLVAGLAEVVVQLPDRLELLGFDGEHDVVGNPGEPLCCTGRTRGHREDELVARACHGASGARLRR